MRSWENAKVTPPARVTTDRSIHDGDAGDAPAGELEFGKRAVVGRGVNQNDAIAGWEEDIFFQTEGLTALQATPIRTWPLPPAVWLTCPIIILFILGIRRLKRPSLDGMSSDSEPKK